VAGNKKLRNPLISIFLDGGSVSVNGISLLYSNPSCIRALRVPLLRIQFGNASSRVEF